jgi:hypothetical protein
VIFSGFPHFIVLSLAHPPEAKERNCILTNCRWVAGQVREGFVTHSDHPSPRKKNEQALS